MRHNKTKAKIKAGQPVFGGFVNMDSPWLVEIMGRMGFDFVLLDAEHGGLSPETVAGLIRAADAADITPIVKVPSKDPNVMYSYLDRGALGIQVPHTVSKADLELIVRTCKFKPVGMRGFRIARPVDMDTNLIQWAQDYNRELMLMGQIEDVEAVENLDEMLTVDEIDGFFVGPGDMSQSLGYPGDYWNPEVKKVCDAAIKKIRAVGKAPGYDCFEWNIQEYLGLGLLYCVAVPTQWLEHGGRYFLKKAKGG